MHHALIFSVHTLGLRRPPGPHRIASFLREQGWDVEVIDYAWTFSQDELREVAKARVNTNTVFVGFGTFFSFWDDNLNKFADWLKETYPTVPLVLGGQSRPRMPSKSIDYYIHGYGEVAMLELAKHLTGNTSTKIAFDPLFFGSKKVITANDTYPAFPMKSLSIKYEARDDIQPWEWLTVEFSRGCKFKCAYCNFPVLGVKGDYSRDAADFEMDMRENYDKWGVTNYYVADETFNDRTEKIIKFADVADTLPFNPIFSGFIRPDLLVKRKQDWDPMIRLGFFGHFYGVETMNHETAKVIGKGMDPTKLKEGLLEVREYFKAQGPFRASMGIVVGLPYETVESQLATLKWAEDNWQGEAIHVWPLEIPLDPKQDVLSQISKDYQGFGYRESSSPIPPPPIELENMGSLTRIQHGISNLNWENDHMSFSQACEISNNFYARVIRKEMHFGISMFNFGDYSGPGIDLNTVLANKSMVDLPDYTTHQREKEYRDKKLNK